MTRERGRSKRISRASPGIQYSSLCACGYPLTKIQMEYLSLIHNVLFTDNRIWKPSRGIWIFLRKKQSHRTKQPSLIASLIRKHERAASVRDIEALSLHRLWRFPNIPQQQRIYIYRASDAATATSLGCSLSRSLSLSRHKAAFSTESQSDRCPEYFNSLAANFLNQSSQPEKSLSVFYNNDEELYI